MLHERERQACCWVSSAVIRINRQRAGVSSHSEQYSPYACNVWYSHTTSSTATARELDASKAQTFAAFSLLLADKGPRNAQSTSLAFSLLLTKGSAQTNKHPPSPSTTAKSTPATFSALSRVGLTNAVWASREFVLKRTPLYYISRTVGRSCGSLN